MKLFRENEVFISSMDDCKTVSSEVIKFIDEAFEYAGIIDKKNVQYKIFPTCGQKYITIEVGFYEKSEEKYASNNFAKVKKIKYSASKDYEFEKSLNPEDVINEIVKEINNHFKTKGYHVESLYLRTFTINK